MNRRRFIRNSSLTLLSMTGLRELHSWVNGLENTELSMPALFVGHGSPMNALEDNIFTAEWKKLGESLPLPKAILCISAHWLTQGTWVTSVEKPPTIHDFGGFPQELFDVQYPAPGNPQLASEITGAIHKTTVKQDLEWGLDHGTWSVLKKMYPLANIPVLQMSIDFYQTGNYHYELAKELTFLRSKGVLIVGSGNIVHNLGMVNWNMPDGGYDWAIEFDEWVKKNIRQNEHDPLKNYKNLGTAAQLAVPTPDHYFPLLYILGLQQKDEKVTFFNDSALMGSLTMTSVMLGEF